MASDPLIDMHSHILPGLDDGAANWEMSLAMARAAVEDGITAMLCTPHWVIGKYESTTAVVLQRVEEFRERLAAENIPLALYPGMELRLDVSIPERLKAGVILSVNNARSYILLEFQEDNSMPDNIDDFLWSLQISGYRPILSHVERNPYCRENPKHLTRWVERGILTQVTAMSLTGEVGEEIKEFSRTLIERRLAHMVVTDAHNLHARKPKLSEARRVIESIAGPQIATAMTLDTPRLILSGAPVPDFEPAPAPKPKPAARWWKCMGSGL